MSLTIHVPKPETRSRRLASMEAPGKPWNRVAGGWISDIAAQRQFIILCPFCVSKFNPRKNHYEVWRQHLTCIGKCDGCGAQSHQSRGFIHQSTHDQVGEWTRPRRGRWAGR